MFLKFVENKYIETNQAVHLIVIYIIKQVINLLKQLVFNYCSYKKIAIHAKANMEYDKQMMTGLIEMGVPADLFKNHKYVVTSTQNVKVKNIHMDCKLYMYIVYYSL